MKSILTLYLIVCSLSAFAQTTFWAIGDGEWTDPLIWSSTQGGLPGTTTPGAGSTVFTDGYSIILNQDITIANLAIRSTNRLDPQIVFGGLFTPYTLSITGALSGVNASGAASAPVESVIEDNPNLIFQFSSTSTAGAIQNWSYAAPINSVRISSGGVVRTNGSSGKLAVTELLEIASGTFRPGENISDASGTASIEVDAGTTLELSLASITGNTGSSSSSFNQINVNGTLTLSGANEFLNVNNLTVASGANFNITTTNANLTQGWWYQSTSPIGTITFQGTVTYGALADQVVSSRVYATLILSGSGTKSATTGSLEVNALLDIKSGVIFNGNNSTEITLKGNVQNSGTFTTTQLVNFEASGTQTISGTGYTFASVDIGNGTTTTTLSLMDAIDVGGSLRVFAGSTLAMSSYPLNLGANITNNGSITTDGSASAKIVFDAGTSSVSISGTSPITLPGIEVNASSKSISAPVTGSLTIEGSLTVTLGTFNAGQSLTTNGDVTVSGTLNAVTTHNINGNLTINSGGSYKAATTTSITGALANSGAFDHNSGTLNFNGTADQSISGSLSVNNIRVSNSTSANGLTINGAVNLNGVLTLVESSSKLNASGSGGVLTVISSGVNSGGRIATLPSPSNFSGSVTVQRYINGPDTWRYLAIPITDGNVYSWQDDFPVTGNFSDPSPEGIDGVIDSSAPSIFYFDPGINDYAAIGSGGSTASTALSNTVGYSVYSYKSGDFTMAVRGTIGKGTVPISISAANGGYNLVPNPYPSAIDWDNVTPPSGLSDAIWIRTANNQFASYVDGVATNAPFSGWTGEIALGQSFWVQSTGATGFSFDEDDKTSNQHEFLRVRDPRDYIRITLSSSEQKDEAVVRFIENAAEGFDESYDAKKRKNGFYRSSLARYSHLNISTYTISASEDFSINGIPYLQCSRTVGLKIEDVAAGGYTIRFSDLDKMDLGYEMKLVDNFLNEEITVEDGLEYRFDVTADASSKGASRFELTFTSPEVDLQRALQLASLQDCSNSFIKLEVDNSQLGIQYVFKLNDANLHAAITGDGDKIYALIDKSQLSFGLNNLSLVASSLDGCHAHIFNDALIVKFDEIYEVQSVTAGEACDAGSVSLSATGAPLDGSYVWYESADAIEPISGAYEGTFNTPSLTESKTYFVAALNATGCESILRVPVEAKIVSSPILEVSVNGNILTVNQKKGIQWYKDGEPISGATGVEFEVRESGVYYCSVSSGPCTIESGATEFVISGIEEPSSQYRIYPNPVDDYLQVSGLPEGATITIYDTRGNSVIRDWLEKSENPGGEQRILDLRGLKKGLYLLNFQKENQVFHFRVLKK